MVGTYILEIDKNDRTLINCGEEQPKDQKMIVGYI